MKKFPVPMVIGVLMLIFIWMPFPRSGLTIRLYLEEFEGEYLLMYYTTDENPQMGIEQTCEGEIDRKNHTVTFRFTPGLADHINGLRLDFPDVEQMLRIRNVSVSGGGVIRNYYKPCDFFAATNISARNGISDISLLESKNMAYIWTEETDPFVIFNGELVSDIFSWRSSYRLTRVLFCALVMAGYVFYRFPLFGGEEGNKQPENDGCEDGLMVK